MIGDVFEWPITNPNELRYSRWNPDVEGSYVEVNNLEDAQKIIEATLERYNDSNERSRLDLILFNRITNEMLKITRAL